MKADLLVPALGEAAGTSPWLVLARRLPVTAVIGVGLAALAACGGGSSGGVNSAPAATATATPTPTATATTTPNTTLIATPSASFLTSEYTKSTGPSQHGAITAWAAGASGQGVTIGIVDSGIDSSNPEFAGRIASASVDVVASRGLTNPDDDHGAMVALVVAAARNNVGIMGMAFNATIAAMRADSVGSCASLGGCTFDDTAIATGLNNAISAGAKVINLSLGGTAPSTAVTTAIARAAAAGVVIVVSAGNDATANPDAFAIALRAAGNGNVIIAGSVGTTNVISSFSDKAGTEAASYLMALGEQVCCQYVNGVIATTTSGGQTYQTVYNGTSFSAPQISGAVALLLQAFPKLTAAQAVQLLLTTATHEGTTTSGADPVYGMGVLNIAAAFTAQGTITLAGAGTQLVLSGTNAVTSPAMGDAGQHAMVQAVVLDAYSRAFGANLAGNLRGAAIAPRLTTALTSRQSAVTLGGGAVAMAFTVDATAQSLALPWSGALRLSHEDADIARVLAGRVMARLSPSTSMGIAFAQGADGLVASLQGQDRPAFMIASNPLEDTGFVRTNETSMAIRRALGQWGLTVSGEQGRGQSGAPWQAIGNPQAGDTSDVIQRFGLGLDRRVGQIEGSIGTSWLGEQRGILGARFNPALGAHGADSVFVDAALGWRPHRDFHFGAAWREGYTKIRAGSLLDRSSHLVSNGWVVDGSVANMFKLGDVVALRVSQPLRVSSGGLNLNLPVGYDYDTGATWGMRTLALNPTGREVATELVWQFPLHGGAANANLFWRHNPGNYANLPMDRGWSLGWKIGF